METTNIRDIIQAIVKKSLPMVSEPAKVLEVNEEAGTCDVAPLNGTADVLDVLLNAGGDSETSITKVPVVDSIVYITYYDKNNAFVSLISELEKLIINNSTVSLEVSDKIYLNGDGFGGIVKADELKTQLDKNTGAINKILDALNNGVAVPQDGGSSLIAGIQAGLVGAETGDFGDIENENVVNG